MSLWVFVVVLAAAALHAGWNALVKQGGDPFLRLAVVVLTGSILCLPLLPWIPPPAARAWPWLFASVAIHIAYDTLLCLAYRRGDLSLTYPVARGLAPPLVAGLAALFAGESLSLPALLAIASVSAGTIALVGPGRVLRAQGRGLLWAALCGVTITLYTLCDARGVRAAGDAWSYILWLFALDGLPFGLAVLWRERRRLAGLATPGLGPAIVGGLFSFAAYALVVWAMAQAPVALVSALRETSVVLAAWIGTRRLGEPSGRRRLAGAALVVLGILLLKLAG
ncbi:MAG: EamA family transporter [Geminicoccaceae bacterium]|nr:EamA family transporter [Geminicoccaceae bacterium]MDW8341699.1 EamA family transporter [Geminicoccaceae bacterium]